MIANLADARIEIERQAKELKTLRAKIEGAVTVMQHAVVELAILQNFKDNSLGINSQINGVALEIEDILTKFELPAQESEGPTNEN